MSAIAFLSGPAVTASARPRDWQRVGWQTARLANLVVMVTLIVGLVVWPAIALPVMWNLLIPVLPASFLIAPQLWRGICPLATLNQWSGGLFGRRQVGGRLLITANALGIVLLVLLVPARRFLFNENGPVLAATIALLAVGVLILGAAFDRRGGFCNSLCPILPVERIYGQHALWKLDNRRCDRCSLCIPKGCLDLDPTKSLAQAVGPAVGRNRWLTTPYGAFAAALPGFIIGYYTTSNGSWSDAPGIYLWIALCSSGSYLATMVVVRILGLTRPVGLALLAASAVVLYYWWAVALITASLDGPVTAVFVGRGAALALVVFWLVRTWPRLHSSRGLKAQSPARLDSATGAVRREYDRLAPSYDRRWRAYEKATLEAVVESARLQGHERVLDIACGTGELERLLLTRRPTLEITGTDLSTGMLLQASAKHEGARASWVQAEAAHLPFANHTFDCAICANSFHYFREPLRALQDAHRVLRPDGRLILVDWCDDYWSCKLCSLWLRLTDPAFCRTYTLRACRALLEESGFEVIRADRFRVLWIWGMMRFVCRRKAATA